MSGRLLRCGGLAVSGALSALAVRRPSPDHTPPEFRTVNTSRYGVLAANDAFAASRRDFHDFGGRFGARLDPREADSLPPASGTDPSVSAASWSAVTPDEAPPTSPRDPSSPRRRRPGEPSAPPHPG